MRSTNINRYIALNDPDVRNGWAPTTNDPQNKALAGVGSPMNEVLCLGSMLNLPSRNAENTAMMKAVYGKMSAMDCMNAGYCTSLNSENTMADGAKPNVMSSANESSSFPNGPETLNNRANIPSKKSNVAPRMMYRIAAS